MNEQSARAGSRFGDAETSVELLRRARAGDGEAMDRLYRRYLPLLRRWASGRLPREARDLVDTDDVVQEIALKTFRGLRGFEPERTGALMAYLRQAILNRIRDEARRARRHPQAGEPDSEHPDGGASPIEEAVGREVVARYEQALARLKDEDREAIVAKIELGLSNEEAADVLGKPSPDAVRMQVGRALLRLAKEMGES